MKSLKLVKEKKEDFSYLPSPDDLSGFIGQERAIEQIERYAQKAALDKKAFTSIIVIGKTGCGKTAIAKAMAKVAGSSYYSLMVTSDMSRHDILYIVEKAERAGAEYVLIHLDEAHNLSRALREMLYSFFECGSLPLIADGAIDPLVTRKVPKLTFVFTTNYPGALGKEFKNRLPRIELDDYTIEDIKKIVSIGGTKMGLSFEGDSLARLAMAANETPREGLMYAWDITKLFSEKVVDSAIVDKYFSLKKIDSTGLPHYHNKVLKFLFNQPNYTARLGVLSSVLGVDTKLIQSTIEPTLFQKHLINSTSMGRKLTRRGIDFVLSLNS